jgi:hypothetical protein
MAAAKKKKKSVAVDVENYRAEVVGEVEIEVTWMCPKRGLVHEKVRGKRYAPMKYVSQINREELEISKLIESNDDADMFL